MINMIPIILITLYYYTHFIEGTYSFFIPLCSSLFWLIHSFTICNISVVLFNKESRWWMAYAFISIMMTVLGFSSTNLSFFISRLPYYLLPPMGYFIIRKYNLKEIKTLLCFIVIIFLANLIYNINLWVILPNVFELQESSELSIQYGVLMNIATTSFIAVCLFSIGCCYMLWETVHGKLFKITILIFCGLNVFYILFVNSRGTAVLLLLVEIIALLVARFEPRKNSRKLYYFSSTVIIISVASFVIVPLLLWIIQNLDSARLAERFEDFISFTRSSGDVNSLSEGSMAQRIALAETSLRSFLSIPLSILIGIGDHTVSVGMDLHKSGIGNHSEFIDVLGRYGLLGAFVFYKILKTYYNKLRSLTNKRIILKYTNVVFLTFILYGFLNNVFTPVIEIFIFIVMPMIIILTNNSMLNYER